MTEQIAKVKIPLNEYSFNNAKGETLDYIPGLKKINLFIGANNSGKSRLLRSLLTTDLLYVPERMDVLEVQKRIGELIGVLNQNFPPSFQSEYNFKNLLRSLETLARQDYVSQHDNLAAEVYTFKDLSFGNPEKEYGWDSKGRAEWGSELDNKMKEILDEYLDNKEKEIFDYFASKKDRRIYIPIVRGLRRFGTQPVNDLIGDHFKTEYFKTNIAGLEMVSGYDFYDTVKNLLLGSHSERRQVAEYEKFLSEYFFEGKEVSLVPREISRVLEIKIGRETQRPIYELGDGIQSLITMTYQICLKQDRSGIVVIEEPELYLHPGGLRLFVKTLLEDPLFEHYQFFFSTHSNHLLDLSLDYDETATYSVHKTIPESEDDEVIAKFIIESEDYGSEQSLAYLGVRNSSVYLSNCTIWVEGVTDRWYIRTFLSLIPESINFKNYIEDLHYSIVEYGGSNITHWSFLNKEEKPINVERLCGKAFLIADKDTKKDKRHTELETILGDRLVILPVQEIENLLSPEVLLKVAESYLQKNDTQLTWKSFTEHKYKNEKLGKFLDYHTPMKHTFAENPGTVTDKVGFCKRAKEHITKWEDLSEDAKNLTLSIVDFIKSQNKHSK